MNGAPAKPISGTRPPSSRLICRIASSTCASASRGSKRRTRVDVRLAAQRVLDRRPFAVDEVEADAHRLERQQQVGEENRRVHLDAADRLQRDFGGEIGRAAQIEQRIALAQRAVLAHVAAGLAHEPDGRGVDRLAAAGLKKSAIRRRSVGHLEEVAGESDQIFEPERLELQLGAKLAQLGRDLIVEEVVAGDDGDRRVALLVARPQPAEEAEAVDERHPQVEDDGVGMASVSASRRPVSAFMRGTDLVAFEPQHPRKRLRHALIVVDNQNRRCLRIGHPDE